MKLKNYYLSVFTSNYVCKDTSSLLITLSKHDNYQTEQNYTYLNKHLSC